jgi:cell division control protein 6
MCSPWERSAARVPKALYLCGKPGVGKTQVVMSVCAFVAEPRNAKGVPGGRPHIAAMNATTLIDPKDIYYKLAEQAAICHGQHDYVHPQCTSNARRDAVKLLHREWGSRMLVVVVDEIDHLFSRGLEASSPRP